MILVIATFATIPSEGNVDGFESEWRWTYKNWVYFHQIFFDCELCSRSPKRSFVVWHPLVKNVANLHLLVSRFKLDHFGSNWISWIKLDRIGSNRVKLDQIGSNSSSLKACSEKILRKTCSEKNNLRAVWDWLSILYYYCS